jgi:acetolactate synthase small subunit
MQETYEIKAKDAPGLLARVESIFRRQRAPIRSFFFEGCPVARLVLVAEADEDRSNLLQKQLLRLEDVIEVVRSRDAAALAQSEFTLEEKTA